MGGRLIARREGAAGERESAPEPGRSAWESRVQPEGPGRARVRVLASGRPLSYREAVDLWAGEAGFRDWFSRLLGHAPFEAYCWETPPVVRSGLDRDFEFALVDVPALRRLRADPQPFADPFARCEPRDGVVAFPNLGGDALLVAPLPIGETSAYAHLASFLRSAPQSQCHALWQRVGVAIQEHAGDHPLWVSTAGLGVSWLHVRLDRRPKYYRFDAYRSPPP